MSEGRKKQKQNPSYKGKGSEIVLVGRQPRRPRLFGGLLQGGALVSAFCPLTPAVVVIHGGRRGWSWCGAWRLSPRPGRGGRSGGEVFKCVRRIVARCERRRG